MNNTGRNDTIVSLLSRVPWLTVYICEAFLILSGNSVTIYIFWRIRKTIKRTSYLLINRAFADLLFGLSLTLQIWEGIGLSIGKEVSSDLGYSARTTAILASRASLVSLALVSLERMFAVLWPFRHRVLETRYYFVSVSVVWLLAALVFAMKHSIVYERAQAGASGAAMAAIVTDMCSLLVIPTAYSAIWIAMKRNQMPSTASRSMVQNRKLARTLFIVTALSIITWLPNCIRMIYSYYQPTYVYSFGDDIVFLMLYSNSFLNPIVYCFRMVEFKKYLRSLLCRCPRRRQSIEHVPSELTKGISLTSLRAVGSVYPL